MVIERDESRLMFFGERKSERDSEDERLKKEKEKRRMMLFVRATLSKENARLGNPSPIRKSEMKQTLRVNWRAI